jgi:hypothetical protein
LEAAMKIDLKEFMAFVSNLQGHEQKTVRGEGFHVEVTPDGLVFTPVSTGKPRKHSLDYMDKVHERFEASGSLKVKDYEFTVEASYHLPLIKLYVESRSA